MIIRVLLIALLSFLGVNTGFSQTSDFTYQGRLAESGASATGSYDLRFELFTAATAGASLGSRERLGVKVASGVFTVTLDFPPTAFRDGENRFLEISVRPVGSPDYTLLSPRQPITSAPYSVKSLLADSTDYASVAGTAENANQLGGIAANQFIQTNDTRLSDARPPTAGSVDYIQNRTTLQATTNFYISGDGRAGGTLQANVVQSSTGYNIGATQVFSTQGTNNVYVGALAGAVTSTGTNNSFVGRSAGTQNSTGSFNSFFGSSAGFANTTGTRNSFFGRSSGASNTGGVDNSFFGYFAGEATTTGANNAFFGSRTGAVNTTGNGNSFFGTQSGSANTGGTDNSFFGRSSGLSNTTGNSNSFFGRSAGQANTTATDNSFFGNRSGAANSTGQVNAFFGSATGQANTSGNENSFFGTAAGFSNTGGNENTFIGRSSGRLNTTGSGNTFVGHDAGLAVTTGSNNTMIGSGSDIQNTPNVLSYATAIGAGATVGRSNTIVLGRANNADLVYAPGGIALDSFAAGENALCATTLPPSLPFGFKIGVCSSSQRGKMNIRNYVGGLDLVSRLRPVTFNWIENNDFGIGFVAEEVGEIEPRLASRDKNDQIIGVKYAQLSTVLVNAVKEQQAQIEEQRAMLAEQQRQIAALKSLICQSSPSAKACQQ